MTDIQVMLTEWEGMFLLETLTKAISVRGEDNIRKTLALTDKLRAAGAHEYAPQPMEFAPPTNTKLTMDVVESESILGRNGKPELARQG